MRPFLYSRSSSDCLSHSVVRPRNSVAGRHEATAVGLVSVRHPLVLSHETDADSAAEAVRLARVRGLETVNATAQIRGPISRAVRLIEETAQMAIENRSSQIEAGAALLRVRVDRRLRFPNNF